MEICLDSIRKDLYINGQWRAGSTGQYFDVVNPATEEVLAQVADGSVEDSLDAVTAAYAAGPAWAATPPRQRSEVLRRAFDLMIANKEALARMITLESGKALAEARNEVDYAAEYLRWFGEEAVRIVGEISTSPSGDKRIVVIRQPIGVALFVTPWNFPAAMATRKIGPALAAGCSVVLKPADETPLTALALASLFEQAGVPPGVINVINTRNPAQAVQVMLNDPRVRKLSFTGSTRVGRLLLSQAAQTINKCSMELGGNAPFIVFADADLDVAIEAAMVAKMRNGGESCSAANRFYVQKPVFAEFTRRLVAAMATIKMGNGLDEGVQLGAMVNASTRDKIAGLVDDAVAQGAKLLTGGVVPPGKGYFYPPTVLADVSKDARVLKEEIFGPVAPIATFETEAEVIALANNTEYGLVGFVQTRDMTKAMRVAEKIESGMIGINRGIVADPAAPFGGVKESGLGREGAHDGLLEYLESKYIAVTW